MKLRYIIAIILLAISVSSLAQIKDYIVKTNGDTLRGELKSANSFTREIRFRTSPNDEFSVYGPNDVVSFSSKGVQRFKSIQNPKEQQKQFCQVLVDGPASLYKPETGFLIEKDNQIYLLEKKDTTFNGMAKEDKKYIGILSAVLTNCESIKTRLKSQQYSAASLTSLISSYNSCVDPAWNKKVYKGRKAGRIIVGIKGGYSTSQMEFQHEQSDLYGAVFTPVNAVPIGVYGSLPITKRFRAQLDLVFTKKGGTNTRDVFNGSYDVTTDTKLEFKYLQIPLTIRYAFSDKRFRPEVFVGVTYSHVLSQEAYKRIHLQGGGTQKTNRQLSPRELGWRGGIALNYLFSDKITGGVEYYYENMLVDPHGGNNAFKSWAHVVSISAGYILGSKADD